MQIERGISVLTAIATQQMNRLEIYFEPTSAMWQVKLGLFKAEEDRLEQALYVITCRIQDYRRKMKP